jgi:hypothetical protein
VIIAKYKKQYKISKFLFNLPYTKILHFKKGKWNKIKFLLKRIKYAKRFHRSFFNNRKTPVNSLRWVKLKKNFLEGINFKRSIFNFFGDTFRLSFFKKIYISRGFSKTKDLLILFPFFLLDAFLFRLGFFRSVKESREAIYAGRVFINGAIVHFNTILNKGDFINIKDAVIYKNFFLKKTFLFAICEIDVYTGSIIVLKDPYSLEPEHYTHIFKERIKSNSFTSYIRRN